MGDLYRYFNEDGELLYVGKSVSAPMRLLKNKYKNSWFDEVVEITIDKIDDPTELMLAEAEAIRTERPKYNVQHNKNR